jgi:hypothetical protein
MVVMSGVEACDWRGGGVSELVTIVIFASWRTLLGLGSEHPHYASMVVIRLARVTAAQHAHQTPSGPRRAPCVVEGF